MEPTTENRQKSA